MRVNMKRFIAAILLVGFLLASCAGTQTDTTSEETEGTSDMTEMTDTTVTTSGEEYNKDGNVTEPETADRAHLPLSYLTDFREKSISISATAREEANVKYTAEYTERGIHVSAVVSDPVIFTKPADIGNGDNISVHIQGANSITRADRFAVHFMCDGEGRYMLRRYSNSDKAYKNVAGLDPKKQNDSFYFTHEKTSEGYTVSFDVSYSFLRLSREQAEGNVRMLLSLRNTDSEAKTEYLVYGADMGLSYDMPNTWLVLDRDNSFVRRDFDTVSFSEDVLSSNKHKNGAFLDNLATLSAVKGTLREAGAGAQVFSDRTYCFEESYLPRELYGTAFLHAGISGGVARVEKEGYVVLAAGELSSYDSLNNKIADAGWERILYASATPYNTAVRINAPDLVNYYVKYCEAGETIELGKWSIPFAKGECVPYPWESEGARLIFDTSDSYYSKSTMIWHGCPSIEITNGKRLISVYSTGDKAEGEPGNYAVISVSDDNGKTWNEVAFINSKKANEAGKNTTVCDTQLWLDRDTNRLYIFYVMSSALSKFEKSSAVWCATVDNPDAPVSEWKVSEHKYLFPGLLRNNITVLSDGRWLAAPNNYLDERFTSVYVSSDKGESWSLLSRAYIPEAVNYDETVITELKDGTLWMTVRANTPKKVVYQSFSHDGGKSWCVSSPTDIFNCTTRFNITRLESGALLMVYNASSGRTDMTAALSYDDGKSWQCKVKLYAPNSTYPDVSVLEVDGTEQIHVIFDHDRYKSASVYHTVLTESFIRDNNGRLLKSSDLNLITKLK